MWKCVKCSREQTNDKHKFCWQCGYRNINAVITQEEIRENNRRGVPNFASIEELVPDPPKYKESTAANIGGSIADIIIGVIVTVVIVPILHNVFGAYGLYISIGFIAAIVIFIFWRVFRPDPRDGKGLGL